MASKPAYPVADLSRVDDFMHGIEDSVTKKRDASRRAIVETALIYAGLRYAAARRADRKRP